MITLTTELQDKLKKLEHWFHGKRGSIVAFSGGIDSTLVLLLARKFQGKKSAIGVISISESLKQKDLKFAIDFCEQFDIKLEIVKTKELEDERYSQNDLERCFFCKDHLFKYLKTINQRYKRFDILSGTNFDDLNDYRPGLQAAKNLNVLSPLADCEVSKEDLRQIARHFGLPNWNKPASPCLSSRIPYGYSINRRKLSQVEAAEDILNDYGFNDVRVRHYNKYGKIEVPKEEIPKLIVIKNEVIQKIAKLGFERIEIDMEGLVSGKMNRKIGKKSL